MKRFAPGWEKHREALRQALDGALRMPAVVLEVGAGTGQHAVFLAGQLPSVTWIPSEVDSALVDSIGSWRAEAALPNLKKPLVVDTTAQTWEAPSVSAIVGIDFVPAVPWAATVGLLRGAARTLPEGGDLLLTGRLADELRADVVRVAAGLRLELVTETDLGGPGALLVFRLR